MRETPLAVAVSDTVADVVTRVVVTVKAAVRDPAGTVTDAGTEATDGLLLDRATVSPPAGAALVSCTVPVASMPPGTVVGSTNTASRRGAVTRARRGSRDYG